MTEFDIVDVSQTLLPKCLKFFTEAQQVYDIRDEVSSSMCESAFQRLVSYTPSDETVESEDDVILVHRGLLVLIEGSRRLLYNECEAGCVLPRTLGCKVTACADRLHHHWAVMFIHHGTIFARKLRAKLSRGEDVLKVCLAYSNCFRSWSCGEGIANEWLQHVSDVTEASNSLRCAYFLEQIRALIPSANDSECKKKMLEQAMKGVERQLREISPLNAPQHPWIAFSLDLMKALQSKHDPQCPEGDKIVDNAKMLSGLALGMDLPTAEKEVSETKKLRKANAEAKKENAEPKSNAEAKEENAEPKSNAEAKEDNAEPKKRAERSIDAVSSRLEEWKETEIVDHQLPLLMRQVAEIIYNAVLLNVKELGTCHRTNLTDVTIKFFKIRKCDHPQPSMVLESKCACKANIGTKAALCVRELSACLERSQFRRDESSIRAEVLTIEAQVRALLHLPWTDEANKARDAARGSILLVRDLEPRLNPARCNASVEGVPPFARLLAQVLMKTEAIKSETALIRMIKEKLGEIEWVKSTFESCRIQRKIGPQRLASVRGEALEDGASESPSESDTEECDTARSDVEVEESVEDPESYAPEVEMTCGSLAFTQVHSSSATSSYYVLQGGERDPQIERYAAKQKKRGRGEVVGDELYTEEELLWHRLRQETKRANSKAFVTR